MLVTAVTSRLKKQIGPSFSKTEDPKRYESLTLNKNEKITICILKAVTHSCRQVLDARYEPRNNVEHSTDNKKG